MNRHVKYIIFLLVLLPSLQCSQPRVNLEKAEVEQILLEFSEHRLSHYLHGGTPVQNTELLEKVLSRHSLRLKDFRPVFHRYLPEQELTLLGKKSK